MPPSLIVRAPRNHRLTRDATFIFSHGIRACPPPPRLHLVSRSAGIHYDAVVAGAGPAGLAVVGNLLERNLGGRGDGNGSILWVDPKFDAGKLNESWREVPSNTKVQLFIEYAKALKPFRKVLDHSQEARDAIQALEGLDASKGCSIAYAADMCKALADGLVDIGAAQPRTGHVTGANLHTKTSTWTVEVASLDADPINATTVATPNLVLCVGSTPKGITLSVPDLDIARVSLDLALMPSKLAKALPSDATVAVVGASHSAILALMNLNGLASTTHPGLRVKWFTRSDLLYAIYKKDYILYDNIGLKGQAADFAREQLEDDKLPTSAAGKYIEKVNSKRQEQAKYEEHLPACTHIVQATGFAANPTPTMTRDGEPMRVHYDAMRGSFRDYYGKPIPGLFGAGIAFPERVTDPEGTIELSVGLWKFMKYLKRVTKDWIPDKESTVSGEARL